MFTLFKEFLVHQQLRLVRIVPANPVYVHIQPHCTGNSTSGLRPCSHEAAVPFPPSPLPFSLRALLRQWKTQHHLLGFWIPVHCRDHCPSSAAKPSDWDIADPSWSFVYHRASIQYLLIGSSHNSGFSFTNLRGLRPIHLCLFEAPQLWPNIPLGTFSLCGQYVAMAFFFFFLKLLD